MPDGSFVYENVLSSMGDGVISLDEDGNIVTCNPAASHILGLRGEDLLNHSFAQVFLLKPELDAFTQGLLDAVYKRGETGQKFVEILVDGETKVLALHTSYHEADGSSADAASQIAVVAVFTDVTELRELQESEARLKQKIEAQYEDLQGAYREMEESQQKLTATLRRVQMIRAVATAAVFGIFLLVAYYTVDLPSTGFAKVIAGTPPPEAPSDTLVMHVVEPMRQVSTVAVPSRLAPGQETAVVSPFDATLSAIHFRYGDHVEAGQVLIDLDVSKIRQQYAERRADYINARKRLRELENWENSREMTSARRSLNQTRKSLEKQEVTLKTTRFLLDQGVIPANEHETAEDTYNNLQLDYEDRQQALQSVREQGDVEALEVAQLEFENARNQLEALEAAMTKSQVRAPVAGIILEPPETPGSVDAGDGITKHLTTGQSVAESQLLLVIADVASLSATGSVNEAEITKLRVGQPVTVTLEAFPEIELSGSLSSVASQASGSSVTGPVKFQVRALLDELTEEQRETLRLGMSIDLSIVVRDIPDALLVPIEAVWPAGGGWVVRVRDRQSGEVRIVSVETGETTPVAVEIVHGLEAGDEVVVHGELSR